MNTTADKVVAPTKQEGNLIFLIGSIIALLFVRVVYLDFFSIVDPVIDMLHQLLLSADPTLSFDLYIVKVILFIFLELIYIALVVFTLILGLKKRHHFAGTFLLLVLPILVDFLLNSWFVIQYGNLSVIIYYHFMMLITALLALFLLVTWIKANKPFSRTIYGVLIILAALFLIGAVVPLFFGKLLGLSSFSFFELLSYRVSEVELAFHYFINSFSSTIFYHLRSALMTILPLTEIVLSTLIIVFMVTLYKAASTPVVAEEIVPVAPSGGIPTTTTTTTTKSTRVVLEDGSVINKPIATTVVSAHTVERPVITAPLPSPSPERSSAPPTPPPAPRPQLSKGPNNPSYWSGGTLGFIWLQIWTSIVLVLSLGLALPWIIVVYIKWSYKHTHYNGGWTPTFNGSGGSLLWKLIVWGFLSIITLGIYSLFIPMKFEQWKMENTILVPDGDQIR